MKHAILLKLDAELVGRIDKLRGDVPRTVWIQRACENGAAMSEATYDAQLTGQGWTKVTRVAPDRNKSTKHVAGFDAVTGKPIYK